MSQIDWRMGLTPDVGQNIMGAFEAGQEKAQKGRERNALAAYVQNPNGQTLGAVTQDNPILGMQLQDREAQKLAAQQKAAADQEERQLMGAALNGDKAARQRLAYVNSDMYMKLGAEQKQQVDAVMKTIGQQAFSILQLPKEQQGAALQQALARLQQQGIDTSGFQLSGNAEQDLKAALAMTGQLDQWEQFAQPKYSPVGEGGLAGFQFGQPIKQGGQPQNFAPQSGIQPGTIEDGYRFKGGNPADPNSWEKAGGQTASRSGSFRP